MSPFAWPTDFISLFDQCCVLYHKGQTDWTSWFSLEEKAFLAGIGCPPREFFDFVEDFLNDGEIDGPGALLIAAVRREYFRTVQKGVPSTHQVQPSDLPAKSAELGGIRWLPRIIAKARAKLRGEMDPETMFGCGGDRAFCEQHSIAPADFLRLVWTAGEDDQAILHAIKG
jgi:Domain of unknown function (DUF5069)